jgi:hypothetical protein
MRDYKKKFQLEYMSSDIKPRGKLRRHIQKSVRQKGKKECTGEVKNLPECEESSMCEEIMLAQFLANLG